MADDDDGDPGAVKTRPYSDAEAARHLGSAGVARLNILTDLANQIVGAFLESEPPAGIGLLVVVVDMAHTPTIGTVDMSSIEVLQEQVKLMIDNTFEQAAVINAHLEAQGQVKN